MFLKQKNVLDESSYQILLSDEFAAAIKPQVPLPPIDRHSPSLWVTIAAIIKQAAAV
jgi:hypothetical protein